MDELNKKISLRAVGDSAAARKAAAKQVRTGGAGAGSAPTLGSLPAFKAGVGGVSDLTSCFTVPPLRNGRTVI